MGFPNLNESSKVPAYRQIVVWYQAAIDDNQLLPGETLPSIRSIAGHIGKSTTTVKRAIDELETQGYVRRSGQSVIVSELRGAISAEDSNWKVFWSYDRRDDELSGGKISQLMQAIRDEYELSTGRKLTDFQDRKDIEWGKDWAEVIEGNLLSTVFFIPILTPAYLRRPHCLGELRTAIGRFAGGDEVGSICPILYIDCKQEIRNLPADELAMFLQKCQWEDFSKVRRLDPKDNRYQERVGEIVDDLINRETELDLAGNNAVSSLVEKFNTPSDGEQGILDRIASLDERANKLITTTDKLGVVMNHVQEIAGIYTEKLGGPSSGKNEFAHRVVLLRQMGADLDVPSREFEQLGKEFSLDVDDIDDSVTAIFQILDFGQNADDEKSQSEICSSIETMCDQVAPTFVGVSKFDASLKMIEPLSRDLRPPLHRMRMALSSIQSTQIVFERWHAMASSCETANQS